MAVSVASHVCSPEHMVTVLRGATVLYFRSGVCAGSTAQQVSTAQSLTVDASNTTHPLMGLQQTPAYTAPNLPQSSGSTSHVRLSSALNRAFRTEYTAKVAKMFHGQLGRHAHRLRLEQLSQQYKARSCAKCRGRAEVLVHSPSNLLFNTVHCTLLTWHTEGAVRF